VIHSICQFRSASFSSSSFSPTPLCGVRVLGACVVNPAGELIGKHHCRPETEERKAQVWKAIAKVYERKVLDERVRSAPLSANARKWTPSAQW
jgi:hypothetical protein